MRIPITIGLLLACSSAVAQQPVQQPDSTASAAAAQLKAIADDYYAQYLSHRPGSAFLNGLPAASDRLDQNSLADIRRWQELEDGWLSRLQRIDRARLSDKQNAVLYAILKEKLTAAQGVRVCHNELWPVRQLFGVQQFPTILAGIQPVGSPERRDSALRRYRAIAPYIDNDIQSLRVGLTRRYTAPRGNVEAVVKQLDGLLVAPEDSSPVLRLALRDSTPEFRVAMVELLRGQLYPALRRYRKFLVAEYLPRTRTTTAIADIPGGRDCYKARVRAFTTLQLTPQEIHQLGLDEMKRVETGMRTVAQRRFGTTDLPKLFERLRGPEFMFSNRDEVIDSAQAALTRVKARLPRWFGKLPRAEMMVDPCQPFEEESGCPNSYLAAAEDGSRPARWRINTNPKRASRVDLEATAFHEGYPGHHLQIALAQEMDAHPVIRVLGSAAFSEGWGLYSERVAHDMGVYSGDLAQIGRLSLSAWRAARLVVDPGVHVLGWSRERAIDYLLAHTVLSRQGATSEVDRYIINPGQATAYMVGRIQIEQLRAKAESGLGDRFDVRAFHDRVLENGSVPLEVLRDQIEAWISTADQRVTAP
jgi:uncharacterized protein (DUF885 family)